MITRVRYNICSCFYDQVIYLLLREHDRSHQWSRNYLALQSSLPSLVWYPFLKVIYLLLREHDRSHQWSRNYLALQSSLPSLVWYLLQSSRVPPIFSVVPASQGNMTGATSGAGTTQPYRAHEFPPFFSVVPVTELKSSPHLQCGTCFSR